MERADRIEGIWRNSNIGLRNHPVILARITDKLTTDGGKKHDLPVYGKLHWQNYNRFQKTYTKPCGTAHMIITERARAVKKRDLSSFLTSCLLFCFYTCFLCLLTTAERRQMTTGSRLTDRSCQSTSLRHGSACTNACAHVQHRCNQPQIVILPYS